MTGVKSLIAASWIPTFLESWTIPAIAASLTLPPLILLYFLKLRRKPMTVSSTFLWKRAVEDLQVNAPFQKLRNNLLLFLQLLILLLAILALWRPVLDMPRERASTLIFLIDNSASMSVIEDSGLTRLELARQEARRMIEGLRSSGTDAGSRIEGMRGGERAMVIAFNEEARSLGPFTENKAELIRRIEAIEQTDRLSRLGEAMALAKAHATPLGEGIGTPDNPVAPAHLILLSDGRIEDAKEIVLRDADKASPGMEYICVGRAVDNVGIVGLDARRNFDEPEQLSVLVRVRNFGPDAIRTDLSLLIDEQLVSVQEVKLEPGMASDEGEGEGTTDEGEAGAPDPEPVDAPEGSIAIVEFPVEYDQAGVVEVRLSREDGLLTDNRAWAVVPAPKSISLLVVSAGNLFLRMVVDSMVLEESRWMTPAEYEQASADELISEGRSRYDVVLFDAHSTDRLVPGSYFFLGAVPLIDGLAVTGTADDEVPIDWQDTHPVLRYIALGYLRVIKTNLLELPRDAETLIEGRRGPMLAEINRSGSRFLIQSFALLDEKGTSWNTPWLLRPGFPLYTLGAVRYLAGVGSGKEGAWRRPGEAINVPATPGRDEITMHRPDGKDDGAAVRGSGDAYYGRTDRVGTYVAEGAVSGRDRYAVSLCADAESRIAPSETLLLGSAPVSGSSRARNVMQPVWPWVLVAILLVLTLEWIIYNKRVFV